MGFVFLHHKLITMLYKRKMVSSGNIIIALLVSINVAILEAAFVKNEKWYWALAVSLPLLLLAIFYIRQKKIYAFRQLSFSRIPPLPPESIQSGTRQHFIESEPDAIPLAGNNNLKTDTKFSAQLN